MVAPTLDDLKNAVPTHKERREEGPSLDSLRRAPGIADGESSSAIAYTTNAFRTFGKDLKMGPCFSRKRLRGSISTGNGSGS